MNKDVKTQVISEDQVQVPKAFWTLRRVLTVSDVINFLALIISILWLSSKYQDFAIDTLQDGSRETLRHLVSDRLGKRYLERIAPVGDNFARNPETVQAVEGWDTKKLKVLIQVLSNHFKEVDIQLRSIVIYDKDMNKITQQGTNEAIEQAKRLYSLLQRRSIRSKRKITPILWRSAEGRPVYSVLIPVGGFRVRGFVELVTNPLPALQGLGSAIGGRIIVVDNDNNVLFSDGDGDNRELFEQGISRNELETINVEFKGTDKTLWTQIQLTKDISQFLEDTTNLRNYVFQAVLIVLAIMILIGWLLVRQTVYLRITNFAKTMRLISQGQINVSIPATGPDEMRIMAKSLAHLREAVRKVEASERKLRELLEASPIGVAIIRSYDGLVIFGNSRIAEIYGIPKKELINQQAHDYHIFGDETKNMIEIFNQSNRVDNYEIESVRADGSAAWSLITMEPFIFQENESIIVWSYDITERVAAEKALRKRMVIDDSLTRISRNFIDHDIASALKFALEEIGQFTQAERCYIYRRNENDKSYDNIQEWFLEDVPEPKNKRLDHNKWDNWIRKKLRDGLSVALHSQKDIPKSARAAHDLFEDEGMQSFLVVPLLHRQALIGFIGLDTITKQKNWHEEDQQFVRLAGELVAIGLARSDAQKELNKARERFELAVSGTRDGIFDFDVENNTSYTSNRWKEMLGMENSEIYDGSQDSFLKLIYPDDRKPYMQSWDEAVDTKQSKWEHECRMYHRNGQVRWILVRGTIVYGDDKEPIRFVGAHTDFTERKEIEAELARKSSILEMTLESMSEGISVIDENLKLTVWNDNFSRLLNLETSKIPEGKKIQPFLDDKLPKKWFKENDLQQFFAMFDLLEQEPEALEKTILQLQSIHDEVLEYHINPMISGGFVITYRDITESKKVERLKNEFVSTVSHELRTPLTSIRGALGLIGGGMVGTIPAKANELLEIATNNCDRLIYLINDILDIEKIEAGRMDFKMNAHLLEEMIDKAITANQGYAEKFNVSYKYDNHSEGTEVYVDDNRLIQVVTNFLSNAAKFSPQEETIDIVTELVEKDQVKISVHDKGPGIDTAFQKRIFSKFAQADSSDTRRKGGTGLGLSISKAIIEQMGGEIGFDTEIGQGTTFYCILPTFKSKKGKATKKGEELVIETSPHIKILMCEDDPDIAMLLSRILEEKGFEIDVCHKAADAMKKLKKKDYDIFALDVNLPDKNGLDLLEDLKADKKTKDIPVIIISGVSKDNKINLGAIGVVDWLEKPIDEDRLVNAFKLYSLQHDAEKPEGLMRILHVEDDQDNARVVNYLLQKQATIDNATTLADAKKKLRKKNQYDLVILDLGLPDGSGLTLLPTINKQCIPVMVFSASDLTPDIEIQVKSALVKSNTTKEQFLKTIEKLTAPKEK